MFVIINRSYLLSFIFLSPATNKLYNKRKTLQKKLFLLCIIILYWVFSLIALTINSVLFHVKLRILDEFHNYINYRLKKKFISLY